MERRRILIIGDAHSVAHTRALLLLLASLGHDVILAGSRPQEAPTPQDLLHRMPLHDMEPVETGPFRAEEAPPPTTPKPQLRQDYGTALPRRQGPPRPAARGLLCRG